MMFEGEALLKYFYSNKIIKVCNALLLLAVLLSSGFYGCSKRLEIEKSDESGSNFKCFNVSARVECLSIERTADFGFIYSGIDKSIPGNAQGFLMKVDSTGKQEWYRTFGGANNDGFEHAIQTSDGGYLAVGSTNSMGIGLNFAFEQTEYIVKINSSGISDWEKEFSWSDANGGNALSSQLNHCAEANDHSFIVAGFLHYAGNNSFPTVHRIDPDTGSVIMTKYFIPENIKYFYPFVNRGGWFDWFSHVSFSDDGNILLSGEMSSTDYIPGSTKKVPILAKLTANAMVPIFYHKYNFEEIKNNQNYVTYLGGYYSWLNFNLSYVRKLAPNKVLNLSDGGYLVGSFITPENNATGTLKFYMSLIKTDERGDYVWSKKFEGLGTAMLWDIQQTKEGNTLLIGSSSTENFSDNSRQGFTNSKIAILTVDKDGNLLKELFIGGDQSICIAKSLHQLSDGGYLIAGISYDSKGDRNKMFYVHVNQDGAIVQ
jgi:hypothetical protein